MGRFQDAIKEIRKKNKLTQEQLGEVLGITKTGIFYWESGRSVPGDEMLEKISKEFGVDYNFLLGKEEFYKTKSSGVKIPTLGVVPAGIPIEMIEDIIDYEEITQKMASQGNHFALKIKGDSMSPRILDGDVVIVRKQENIDSGDIAIVMVNGFDATCKKVLIKENGVMLQPLNQNYDAVFYTPQQIGELPVNIVGKVVELRGKF